MSLETGVTSATLEDYFERYGWSVEQLDTITFRTGFRGRNATFTALVRLTEHWVVFTINPLVRPPENGWGASSLETLSRKRFRPIPICSHPYFSSTSTRALRASRWRNALSPNKSETWLANSSGSSAINSCSP